jgi:hypothetical protein
MLETVRDARTRLAFARAHAERGAILRALLGFGPR